ncbi:response regulator [Vibrio sp. SS-MA-C1-2]|uniref:response regulator n=1 Tax=Vibrio sp. SS-MA-C1-2 TaxID=2908646 RepID=UPI0038FCE75B
MLVDDHPLMRKGIHQLLSFEEDFDVIADISNGAEAIAQAKILQPDLILLDLNMEGMSGLDTLKALQVDNSSAKVVILTVSDSAIDIETLFKAGADGYILKDTELDELLAIIRQVLAGQKGYSAKVLNILDSLNDENDPFNQLTEREAQILKEVSKGYRNRDIATNLFISEATVKVHLKSLFKKLNVSSRTEVTILYLERYGETLTS